MYETDGIEPEIRPEPTEIILRSTEVTLPDEAVVINDRSYQLGVNTEAMAWTVNTTNRKVSQVGLFHSDQAVAYALAGIDVFFEDSSQRLLETSFEQPDKPALYDPDTNRISLDLPAEVKSSEHTDEELVKQYQERLNKQLAIGLSQYTRYKGWYTRYGNFWRIQIKGVGPVAGTAVALATSSENTRSATEQLLLRGGIGAAAGYVAMTAVGMAYTLATDKIRKPDDRAIRAAVKWSYRPSHHATLSRNSPIFLEPIATVEESEDNFSWKASADDLPVAAN